MQNAAAGKLVGPYGIEREMGAVGGNLFFLFFLAECIWARAAAIC